MGESGEYRALTPAAAPKIEVSHGRVIIYEPGEPESEPAREISSCCYYSELALSGLLAGGKVISSLGSVIYGLEKLFYEERYIYSEDFFNKLPHTLAFSTIVWVGVSDLLMNLATRGAAIRRLMQELFGNGRSVEEADFFQKTTHKLAKYALKGCGYIVALFSSMGSFLGTTTLLRLVTNNFNVLVSVGAVFAGINFVSKVSYAQKKAIRNLKKFLNKELTYDPMSVFFCAIGLGATLGLYYFGTSEAIRLVLNMFDVYHGDPDSREGLIAEYENWINGITDFSLVVTVPNYFFTSCCEMLSPVREIKKAHACIEFGVFEKNHQALLKANRGVEGRQTYTDYFHLKSLRFFSISFISFFIAGEVSGNALQNFNGINGLIIHLFMPDNDNVFNQAQKIEIGVASAFLSLVASVIYWKFNVIDWRDKMREYWVKAVIKTYIKAGLYQPSAEHAFEDLQDVLTRHVSETQSSPKKIKNYTEFANQPVSFWGRVKRFFGCDYARATQFDEAYEESLLEEVNTQPG